MRWVAAGAAVLLVGAGLVAPPETPVRCVIHVEGLVYPPIARAARLHGEVTILLSVGSRGEVAAATVVAGNPLLGKAAAQNARTWRFEPGPEERIQTIYEFRIAGQPAENPPTTVSFDLPGRVLVSTRPLIPDIYTSPVPRR